MTKEEFINKWCFNDNRVGMDYDFDQVIKSKRLLVPTVDPDMEGLGHQWVFPSLETYETAYCICINCGVTSEEMESEELCTNPTGGEND
ncbi:hypothetical protein KA005_25060 [bacterium]|nr:hypothetical protein [bacterium]